MYGSTNNFELNEIIKIDIQNTICEGYFTFNTSKKRQFQFDNLKKKQNCH